MIWKILRPRFWMLDRSVRRLNRFVVGALFLLLGLGGNWLYNNLLLPNLALLRHPACLYRTTRTCHHPP